jgi:hypothetical protein
MHRRTWQGGTWLSRFEVALDELVELSHQLAAVKAGLRGVGAALRVGGAAGSDQVAAALDRFGDQWDYALGKIAEHAANLASDLVSASEAYSATEQAIAGAFGG